jgi:hypothetical protein
MNTTLALTVAMAAAAHTYTDWSLPSAAPHSRWRYDPSARLRHASSGQRAKRKAARRAHPHGF